MYAVIKTGGKQYRVQEGDVFSIEKLNIAAGEKVVFEEVLGVGVGNDFTFGTPFIEGAQVFGRVVESGKGEKVIIYKYKAKKDYRKKQGHRQPYTMVEITGILEDKKAAPTKASSVVENKVQAEEKKPALKSMKKAELIAFAKENNIEIDEKATNAILIETIEKSLS